MLCRLYISDGKTNATLYENGFVRQGLVTEAAWQNTVWSREQICLYLKAVPFVIIKVPKRQNPNASSTYVALYVFNSCKFQRLIDCQGFFWGEYGYLVRFLLVVECEPLHSIGNTVCIGIWKCLKNSKIRVRTALSTEKGWRIYSRDCVESNWVWGATAIWWIDTGKQSHGKMQPLTMG